MFIRHWLRKKAVLDSIKDAIVSISDSLDIIAKELEEIRAFQESLDIMVSEIRDKLKELKRNE